MYGYSYNHPDIFFFFFEIVTIVRNILRCVHVPRCLCNRRSCLTSKAWYIWGLGIGFCTWLEFLALFITSIFFVLPRQIESYIRYTEKPWAISEFPESYVTPDLNVYNKHTGLRTVVPCSIIIIFNPCFSLSCQCLLIPTLFDCWLLNGYCGRWLLWIYWIGIIGLIYAVRKSCPRS